MVVRQTGEHMKARTFIAAAALAAASTVAIGVSAASAEQPVEPGCNGQAVVVRNHASGTNDTNSKGPGYFFRDGQTVKSRIKHARLVDCGL
jgi:hypothetical protein